MKYIISWRERPAASAKRIRSRVWIAGLTFLLFVVPCSSFAQQATATILGTVKDTSGGVVPGANVTARNTDTGQVRTAITEGDGSYRLSALPIGNYDVRIEHEGFQSEVRAGLTLTVGQEAVINVALQIGTTDQTVTVTAEAPLVNTTSGSLGGLVDPDKMADLPLNGRNYADLTLMQMGVTQSTGVTTSSAYVGTYFSSNGAPVRSNNYLLDGAILVNLWGVSSASATSTTLGVDGIKEYKLVTNSFSAEYGMTMVSCLSWKWRKRSSVKITERTHEETTEALHAGREGRHSEEAFGGRGADLGSV